MPKTMTMSMRSAATIAYQDEVIGFDGTRMRSAGLECAMSFGPDFRLESPFDRALRQNLLYITPPGLDGLSFSKKLPISISSALILSC